MRKYTPIALAVAIAFISVIAAGCNKRAASSTGNAMNGKDAPAKGLPEDALARKARSIAILKAENVPFIDRLPVIEDEANSKRRKTEEVAKRAMALCLVAIKGEGIEPKDFEKITNDYKLTNDFTPKEKTFISKPKPNEQERLQFLWRFECYWVMLWALGYVDKLERPDNQSDAARAVAFLRDSTRDEFLKKAKLRSQREILDAADLFYRYYWAVEDARINHREAPARLNGDVAMERLYALNWLIGYMDQEWDGISTDT